MEENTAEIPSIFPIRNMSLALCHSKKQEMQRNSEHSAQWELQQELVIITMFIMCCSRYQTEQKFNFTNSKPTGLYRKNKVFSVECTLRS